MNTLTQRYHVLKAIQTLPDDSIDELANFIAYLQHKLVNQTTSDLFTKLDPNKTYEVWTPIEAPEAAATLMALLAAEKETSHVQ